MSEITNYSTTIGSVRLKTTSFRTYEWSYTIEEDISFLISRRRRIIHYYNFDFISSSDCLTFLKFLVQYLIYQQL